LRKVIKVIMNLKEMDSSNGDDVKGDFERDDGSAPHCGSGY